MRSSALAHVEREQNRIFLIHFLDPSTNFIGDTWMHESVYYIYHEVHGRKDVSKWTTPILNQ